MTDKQFQTREDLIQLFEEITHHFASNKKDKGINLLQAGLQAANKIDEAYAAFFESEIAYATGNSQGRREWMSKALELRKNDYFLLRSKGSLLSAIREYEQALAFFDLALEINPQDYICLREKGVVLSKLNKNEEALYLFDSALEIRSEDYLSIGEKGCVLSKIGNDEAAILSFDRALSINPGHLQSLIGKSTALYNTGDYTQALQVAEKAYRSAPENESVKSNYEYLSEYLRNLKDDKTPQHSPQPPMPEAEEDESEAQAKVTKLKALVDVTRQNFQNAIDRFIVQMDRSEAEINNLLKAQCTLDGNESMFFVLRRWNSYTPILGNANGDDSVGGGYFLFHKGEGVVIDPGYNFIGNFHNAGLRIKDIRHIIITHAHNDHTVDFESLLSLFYKYENITGETLDITYHMNLSAYRKLGPLIDLKTAHRRVEVISPGMSVDLAAHKGLTMKVLPAYHRDTLAEGHSIGLRFILEYEERTRNIVMTSDTSLLPAEKGKQHVNPEAKQIWERYNLGNVTPDLLIPHIGSVRKEEFQKNMDTDFAKLFYPNHLGVMGTLGVIVNTRPVLAVVSEFGEELRDFRPQLLALLAETTKKHCLQKGIPPINVVGGDLPFVYNIETARVYCLIEKDFVPAEDIRSREIRCGNQEWPLMYFHKKHKEAAKGREGERAADAYVECCKRQTGYFKKN